MQEELKDARPRVVIDSNVWVSALVSERGRPAEVVAAARHGRIVACVSPFILAEVTRTLWQVFHWSDAAVEDATTRIRNTSLLSDPPTKAAIASLSPADNRILDCAVYCGASFLVTGDKAIRKLGDYKGVQVLTPAEFTGTVLGEH